MDSEILDPRKTYADELEWQIKAKDLGKLFVANFEQYATNEEGKNLRKAGPQVV